MRPLPERFPEVDQFDDVVQLVALVELHVSVDRPPLVTAVGETERVAVAAGVTTMATQTLPFHELPVAQLAVAVCVANTVIVP